MRLGLIRDEKSRKMALENVIGVHTSGDFGEGVCTRCTHLGGLRGMCARDAHTWPIWESCVQRAGTQQTLLESRCALNEHFAGKRGGLFDEWAAPPGSGGFVERK